MTDRKEVLVVLKGIVASILKWLRFDMECEKDRFFS